MRQRGASWEVISQGAAGNHKILDATVVADANQVRYLNSRSTVGTVSLRGGRKVSVRMGDDGYFFFLASLGGGRYLYVSTSHFKQQQSFLRYAPSAAQLPTLADLQTLGKHRYITNSDYRVPIECLRIIAGRTVRT